MTVIERHRHARSVRRQLALAGLTAAAARNHFAAAQNPAPRHRRDDLDTWSADEPIPFVLGEKAEDI